MNFSNYLSSACVGILAYQQCLTYHRQWWILKHRQSCESALWGSGQHPEEQRGHLSPAQAPGSRVGLLLNNQAPHSPVSYPFSHFLWKNRKVCFLPKTTSTYTMLNGCTLPNLLASPWSKGTKQISHHWRPGAPLVVALFLTQAERKGWETGSRIS